MKRWIYFFTIAMATTAISALAEEFKYPAYVGRMDCADKVVVTITADKKIPNRFDITIGKTNFKTVRVATDSGAIRLEDKAHGIVWLQMSNKSMLLSEKQGKRLAVDCRNEAQIAAEKELLKSPPVFIEGKPL